MTILAVPTNEKKGLESKIAEHFGRCKNYVLIDEKGNLIKIIENTSQHVGGKKLPPELMKDHNAKVLLCKAIGPRAINLCNKLKIKVYLGKEENVKQIFRKWKNNELSMTGEKNACKDSKH